MWNVQNLVYEKNQSANLINKFEIHLYGCHPNQKCLNIIKHVFTH
jgi:hypothetical protein